MKLTQKNYYSKKADNEYMSVSQFKSFLECEAATMAMLAGKYEKPKTTALLVGSYVDAWFDGTLNKFKEENPEIFKKDGTLKADYLTAERVIERVQQDALFMEFMSGAKQKIVTGKLFGVEWKGKIDSYHKDKIVDLKTARSLQRVMGKSMVDHFRYDIQGAVYQALEGHNLPFYLAIATKEDPVDIEICEIETADLQNALEFVEKQLPRIMAVKKGEVEPTRCGVCPYCRQTKKLTAPIPASDLGFSEKELSFMRGEI